MKTILMVFFALMLFPVMLPQGHACECFGTQDYAPIVDDSELVFIGTVNDIVADGEHHMVFVTFDVHSIAKGELTGNQVTTNTPPSDCSVDYKIGTTYVVVIYEKEFLSTDRCSTKPLEIMAYYEVIPDSLLSAMAEPEVAGSYEVDENAKKICYGGPGMILNDQCQRIGIYDPQTGIPIVNNKEECDKLDGTWYDDRKLCDSKHAPAEYRFQFGPEPMESEIQRESANSFSSTYPRQSSTDLPLIIIVIFGLGMGLLVYWFTWGKRR